MRASINITVELDCKDLVERRMAVEAPSEELLSELLAEVLAERAAVLGMDALAAAQAAPCRTKDAAVAAPAAAG